MILKLKNPMEWANNSGYETQVIEDSYKGKIELVYSPYPAFQIGNDLITKKPYDKPICISAHDVKLLVINSERAEDKHNYKYLIISKNNDLLIDENVNNEIWLNYFKVFRKIKLNDDKQAIEINNDLLNNSVKITEKNYLIYVGGQSHFGHWLVDHLSIMLLCEKNKIRQNNEKYITSQLNESQIESIKSANIDCDILQIDLKKNYLTLIDVPFLKIVANQSIFKSYDLLKSKLAMQENELFKETVYGNKNCIYFQRGEQRGIERVVNENEVIELMMSKKIDIIKPHTLTLLEKKILINKYDLIICPPASAYFNFYIFSKQKAQMIYCIHESALYNTDSAVFGGSYYQCPDLYRTTLIPSMQPSIDKYKEPLYDAKCIIDIQFLKVKIDEFMKD